MLLLLLKFRKMKWMHGGLTGRKIGYLPDPKLATATSLQYYSYSTGLGALSISSFKPITNEQMKILERFRNVFGLAYRRYVDVAQAEAQAREAQIEASLERMRAVAMSMRKSEELIAVCESMYKELTALGFTNIRNAQIAIKNDTKQSYLVCEYSDYNVTIMQEAPYNSSPIVMELYDELEKSKDAFYQKEFSGKEFDDWRAWRTGITTAIDSRLAAATSMCFYLYSIGIGHLGISTFNAITNEQLEILKRFRNVFELSYRRYMDVAQAEAQAREAQIEAALERVRARAMAMQKSDDLANAVAILFEELDKLNLDISRCGIGIIDKEKRTADVWSTTKSDNDTIAQVSGDESMDIHPLLKGAFDAWLKQEDYNYFLKGRDLNDYYKALTGVNFKLPDSQSWVSGREETAQYHFNAIFSAGGLFAFSEAVFSDEAKP